MNAKVLHIFLIVSIGISSLHNARSQVLNNETSITIDAKGRKTIERRLLVQINDKQANWLSHIEIGHDPRQKFSFNYARILDTRGNTLRKLKKKDLRTRNDLSYQAFYQDDLITEFDLYWNQYPYQIAYSYTITEEEYLYAAWWTPLLYSNVATLKSSLELNVPSGYEIIINQIGNLTYEELKAADGKVYSWRSSAVRLTKDEIYSPPTRELIPMVWAAPSRFNYGVSGSSDSWSSFGLWLNNLNEGTDQLPLNEKIMIEQLIGGMDDEREIVRTIYHYLQDHTRYINVAIDVGGLKSYPASYVCQNKYGDCKALTTYMKAMLKSVGIESHYTVINAGRNEAKIRAHFPGQQFNHVILAIPLESDTVWLENTSNALPFNYLGTFTQDRYALAVDKEKSKLVRTPKLQPSDVLVQRDYVFTAEENDAWQSDITLHLRGRSFENFRHSLSNQKKADQKSQVIKNIHINGFNLVSWNLVDFHRDSSQVKIDASGECSSPIRKIGTWGAINPLKILIPDFEKPGNRHLDVRIKYPINKSDRIVYKMRNLGDKKVKIPEGVNIDSAYGQYSIDYIREGDSFIIHEKFILLDNDISVDQYADFYAFIESIINHRKKSAILIQ